MKKVFEIKKSNDDTLDSIVASDMPFRRHIAQRAGLGYIPGRITGANAKIRAGEVAHTSKYVIAQNMADYLTERKISTVAGSDGRMAIINFKPAHETIIHMLMCEHFPEYYVESVEKLGKQNALTYALRLCSNIW
jgi:ribonucleoside-diphosphate reductase alpha chain